MAGVAAATVAGGALSFLGSQGAGNAQAGAMNASTGLQKEMFDYQKEQNAPYQQAGVAALGQMQDPRFQKNFGLSDFQTSPGYQFSLQQGQDAIKAANSATGNSVSGAGLAALGSYTTGTANQEYQQAFNNYQDQLNNQYGRLSTLASGGQGANQAMGYAAANYGKNAASSIQGAGGAQAGAILGQTGALGGTLSKLAGMIPPSSASSPGPTGNYAGNFGESSMGEMSGISPGGDSFRTLVS